ncbi:MAG: hypothetical protein ABI629_01530 [bacterium]
MDSSRPDTHLKALTINLDPAIYGVLAEIGAGQEVARWFLQVGAASGTVAKTISAYDMTVSDAIYGKVSRYVSRERVEGMLTHEWDLLLDRLGPSKGATTRFFAFADTISARNFGGVNECHGWLGIRFQTQPGGAANTAILHVNLLDQNNLLQQQAVGILGVNLVYAVFHHRDSLPEFLTALFEELSGRVEVDLFAPSGPDLAGLDDRTATLELLTQGLAEAVLFPVDGAPRPPSELLRKRPLVFAPGVFAQVEPLHHAMLSSSCTRLATELDAAHREPLPLFVLSPRHIDAESTASSETLATRVEQLRALGCDVLVSREPELYRLVRYALRYTAEPIRIVLGAVTVADLLRTRLYKGLNGELMEALARLFAYNVHMYVYPTPTQVLDRLSAESASWFTTPGDDGMITLEHLRVPAPQSHLLAYLIDSGVIYSVPTA